MPYSRVQGTGRDSCTRVVARHRSLDDVRKGLESRVVNYVRDQVIAINVLGPLILKWFLVVHSDCMVSADRTARAVRVGRTRRGSFRARDAVCGAYVARMRECGAGKMLMIWGCNDDKFIFKSQVRAARSHGIGMRANDWSREYM
jgi:hypothetical protein